MEKLSLDENIKVFCVTAESFPAGIMAAHEKLHATVPFSTNRRYFGISRPEKGIIVYKAAAEEINAGEAEKYNCEPFVIPKGQYISLTITDYMKDVSEIGRVFQQLLSNPEIDPQGYCIEWYLKGKDVRCMVRLKG